MIDATIDEGSATIRVVSGALDITYEVRTSDLYRRQHNWAGDRWVKTGATGYVLDLSGVDREPRDWQPPYIFGSTNFETTVKRALSKARHLERLWRGTRVREPVAA